MHMADALISPAVGGTLWTATAGLVSYAAKKVGKELDEKKIPLMGVLGAFVFAAQMINFTIPGTGSSGHLGGGLLLAILLGPYAGFLTMASILTVQALFFADGGLLALGCNIFNLGFFPCFIAYPLIYKRIVGQVLTRRGLFIGAGLASVIGLQLGAFGVVVETLVSGVTALSFSDFFLLMQPIHLAIGVVEGLITAAVILFVWHERPEIVRNESFQEEPASYKGILVKFLLAAVFMGSVLTWFASTNPDGLEWSVAKATGQEELTIQYGIHKLFADVQQKIAIFPDYSLREPDQAAAAKDAKEGKPAWPAVDGGNSLAGVVGSLLVLLLAGFIGKGIKLVLR